MFAVFFMEEMNPFYENIASFPTVFFTFFLLLSFLFWIVAMLGWLDIEVLDFDMLGSDSDISNQDVASGLMNTLGLNGVPVTLVVSIISLVGWFVCYYLVHFIHPVVPDGLLSFIVSIPILLGSLYVAVLVAAQIIKPLRKIFKESAQHAKHVVGQVAIVKTSRVDSAFGEAIVEDGGASLLIKVRASDDESFKKGDRLVVVEYIEDQGVYRVISESEFTGS